MARLTIVTAAEDLLLASMEDLRVAAGLTRTDESRDDELSAIGGRVSAEIIAACSIAPGTGAPPTLRRERVSETFAARGDEVLILARRHDVEIVSIAEDGESITLDDRGVDAEAGLLERWVSGRKGRWCADETVIVYDAGFEELPAELAGTVADLVRIRLSEAAADPLVKGYETDIPGVMRERVDRWVGSLPGSATAGGLPVGFMARLERFINRQMR
jgi:hypothetical protein